MNKEYYCDFGINQAENVLKLSGLAGIQASSNEILNNPK